MSLLRRRCRECNAVRVVDSVTARCGACGAAYGRFVIGLDQPVSTGALTPEPKQEPGQTSAFAPHEVARTDGTL